VFFFFLSFVLVSLAAPGDAPSFLAHVKLTDRGIESTGDYVVPTEHNPREAIPLVKDAPPGVYVSVGLDRSFIGSAITPGASHLLVLDRDRTIVELTLFNAGLLAIAKNAADYRHLRQKASFDEIVRRAGKAENIASDYLAALRSESTWGDLDFYIRENRPFDPDHFNEEYFLSSLLHEAPAKKGDYAYKDANYLYDEALFAKLQEMARAGHISALACDLGNPKSVEPVVDALAGKKLKLSVLDLSDTWYYGKRVSLSYLPPKKSLELWRTFLKVADKKSVLLLTAMHNLEERRVADTRWGKRSHYPHPFYKWIYFALNFKTIANEEQTKAALDKMLDHYQRTRAGDAEWAGTFCDGWARLGAKPKKAKRSLKGKGA
jgi:hypothetical protein